MAAESSKKPDVAIAPAITDQMSSNAVRRVVMGDFHDAQRTKVSGGEAVRLTAELDPKAKRERPALKMCAAQEKPLGHEGGAALQEG